MRFAQALDAAVNKAVKNERAPAVLFSGGVDSCVLAKLAKAANPSTILYTVGTGSSEDLARARETAKALGMRQEEIILSDGEIARLFSEAKRVTGEKRFMKLELSVVLLALCERAKGDGASVLLSGAGAEELFLGYASHAKAFYEKRDLDELRAQELAGLYGKDLKRNERIAESCGVRLACPFTDARVKKEALSFPAKENFRGGENKAVLRWLARGLGLPEEACARKKRAMQYGSGVHERLAKMMRAGIITL